MVCAGHQGLVVTADYEGAHEHGALFNSFDPNRISHAAALEVARDASVQGTVFAMGWIPQASTIPKVALYRYNPSGFTATVTLPYSGSSRKWIARSGYDPDCAAVVSGATSCAWFSWTDNYGDVDWIAVGDNGGTGGLDWVHGWDASGDVGIVYFSSYTLKRQLRVYISPDRTQVLGRIYEGTTPVSGPFILRTVQNNFNAFQTAVAWSERNQRWLVVWGEYYMKDDHYWKSKVTSRVVHFDGTLGQAKSVMYCETDPRESRCPPTKGPDELIAARGVPVISNADGGGARTDSGPDASTGKHNVGCACYGIWLGASRQWETWPDVDAFRVHQYGVQARVDGEGTRVALYHNSYGLQELTHPCSVWCPLDSLSPKAIKESVGVYQMARPGGVHQSEMVYLTVASPTTVLQDVIHPVSLLPQALRTTGDLTATLATDKMYTEVGSPPTLRLTISDAGSGVCP